MKLNQLEKNILYYRYKGNILKLYKTGENIYTEKTTCMSYDLTKSLLLGKRSKNIIDLIEIGDYVNGYKVLNIEDDGYLLIDDNGYKHFPPINIVTVVTHEQFAKMEMRV